MNLKNLQISSQNIYKNCLLIDIILENYKNFDIIFIQKPSWSIIQNISSSSSKEGKKLLVLPIILHRLPFQDNWLIKTNTLELSPILTSNSLNYISHLEKIL